MNHFLSIIKQVRKLKTELNLSLKIELELLTIVTSKDLEPILKQEEQLIKAITKSKNLEFNFDQNLESKIINQDGVFKVIAIEL